MSGYSEHLPLFKEDDNMLIILGSMLIMFFETMLHKFLNMVQ